MFSIINSSQTILFSTLLLLVSACSNTVRQSTTEGQPSNSASNVVAPDAADMETTPVDRAMGGEAVSINEYPWQVGLVHTGRDTYQGQFCGGSLIEPTWVLTAAHCVEDNGRVNAPSEIQIYSGSADLEGNGRLTDVQQIISHPAYTGQGSSDHDIALIELARPLNSTTVRLAGRDVDARSANAVGQNSVVTGWGEYIPAKPRTDTVSVGTQRSGNNRLGFPTLLQATEVPIVSNERCGQGLSTSLNQSHICAGIPGSGRDACSGDSGGPLHIGDNVNNRVQVGIVSWGRDCSSGGYYNVYTRVSTYEDWIVGVTSGTETTPDAACNNACRTANDNECDDGGPNSLYAICDLGTDCADCGPREPGTRSMKICANTCQYARDGECDDGGPDSLYDLCELGSDCADCGVRTP